MSESARKLLSFNGRLDRTGFLRSLLFLVVTVIGLNLVLDILLMSELLLSVEFLVARRLLEIAYLSAWTPFIVRRLHDTGLSGRWVILCWISLPLDQRFLLLIEVIDGTRLELPMPLLAAFEVTLPLMTLFLLLKPGTAGVNRWGKPAD